MYKWAVIIFLPSRKFLLGMLTRRWTVMFFSPWMAAAVLRIKSSGLSEVTMSIYSALHYTQLINIHRNAHETVQRRRRTAKCCRQGREGIWVSEYEYDIAGLVNEAFVKVYWLELARNGLFCTGCIHSVEIFVTIWMTQVSEQLKMKWLTIRRLQQAMTVTCGSHEEWTASCSQAARKETMLEMKYLP